MSTDATSNMSQDEDCVFSREQAAPLLTDEQLMIGVIPHSTGIKSDDKKSDIVSNAQEKNTSQKGKERAVVQAETSQTLHKRTLSTESERSLYNLDTRMELMKLRSEIVDLREIVDKQATLISKLTSSDIENRTLLEKLAKLFETETKGIHATIDAKTLDLRKRIDETLQVHRDTPSMVENLIARTNEIMTYLPEETKAGMKAVRLTPEEKKTIETVRKHTEIPKKKIPSHLRHLM